MINLITKDLNSKLYIFSKRIILPLYEESDNDSKKGLHSLSNKIYVMNTVNVSVMSVLLQRIARNVWSPIVLTVQHD